MTHIQYLITPASVILLENTANKGVKPVGICKTRDFIDSLCKSFPMSTPLLPSGTIFYKQYLHDNLEKYKIIVEQPPTIRELPFASDNRRYSRNLSFPYTYFCIDLQKNKSDNKLIHSVSYLYCSPKKITDIKQTVYRMFLNNISLSAKICWGDAEFSTSDDLSYSIKNIINSFYKSPFNSDYQHVLRRTLPENISDYRTWEDKTKELGNDISVHNKFWQTVEFKIKKSLMDFISDEY